MIGGEEIVCREDGAEALASARCWERSATRKLSDRAIFTTSVQGAPAFKTQFHGRDFHFGTIKEPQSLSKTSVI